MHGWMTGTWKSAREGAKAIGALAPRPSKRHVARLLDPLDGRHRRLPIISSVRPAVPSPGPPLIPCTVFLRDFTFVRVYVAAAAAAYDRCALLGRMHDGRRYPSIVDPWIVHLQLSKSKKTWPGRPMSGSSGSPLVLANVRPVRLAYTGASYIHVWFISRTFSANEQYFSLTTNQPTVLSAMAYQPSEQSISKKLVFAATQIAPSPTTSLAVTGASPDIARDP